tara:strand:+ start:87 stop:227 length:141 start_codon:yes stop_codon:yes gene_type:complete
MENSSLSDPTILKEKDHEIASLQKQLRKSKDENKVLKQEIEKILMD